MRDADEQGWRLTVAEGVARLVRVVTTVVDVITREIFRDAERVETLQVAAADGC